jgi:prophage regulatory protein
MNDRPSLERLPAVLARTANSRSQLYADIKAGTFPAPAKIGERSVAWLTTEVDAWCLTRVEARRPLTAPTTFGD